MSEHLNLIRGDNFCFVNLVAIRLLIPVNNYFILNNVLVKKIKNVFKSAWIPWKVLAVPSDDNIPGVACFGSARIVDHSKLKCCLNVGFKGSPITFD